MFWGARGRWSVGTATAALLVAVAVVPGAGGAQQSASDSVVEAPAVQARETVQRRAAAPAESEPARPSDAFSHLTADEALETAQDEHGSLFPVGPTRLVDAAGEVDVQRWLSDSSARVDLEGDGSSRSVVVQSDLPLRVEAEGQLRAVDLEVVERDGGYEPRVGLVDSHIPTRADGAIAVSPRIALRLRGAQAAGGELVGQQVFYGNALEDSDLLATVVPGGVATHVALRSPSSPRTLVFDFEIPAGARIIEQLVDGETTGWLNVVHEEQVIAQVAPIAAWDAAQRPVPVDVELEGTALTVTVRPGADQPLPWVVDPIVEERMFAGDNQSDPNGSFSDTRGWRPENPQNNMAFTPNQAAPTQGGQCPRDWNPSTGQFTFVNGTLCVGAAGNVNHGASSAGQWTFRPPYGTRSIFDDLNGTRSTDAYVQRVAMRNAFVKILGNTTNPFLFSGLFAPKLGAYVGVNDSSQSGGGSWTANPFVLAGNTNTSFFRTYCLNTGCTAQLSPNLDGTFVVFGLGASGTGASGYATGQGAIIVQSDRTPPSVSPVPNYDTTRWWRTESLAIRVDGHDEGLGTFGARISGTDVNGQPFLLQTFQPCLANRVAPCNEDYSVSFPFSAANMPEGTRQIEARATDPTDQFGAVNVPVRVDRTFPAVDAPAGSLAAKNGRAVADGQYTLSTVARDGSDRSGVERVDFLLDGQPWRTVHGSCAGNQCAADLPAAQTIDTATLAAGLHRIEIVAADKAGNALPVAQGRRVDFVVDHAAPGIVSVTQGQDMSRWYGPKSLSAMPRALDDASGTAEFRFTREGAPESALIIGCDDRIVNACSRDETRTLSYSAGGMTDGPGRRVAARAIDAVGHVSAEFAWTINVDQAGPAITLSGGAWDRRNRPVADGDLTLRADARDSVGGQQRSGVRRIEVRIDGQVPAPAADYVVEQACVSSPTQPCDLGRDFVIHTGGLASGAHTISIVAFDNSDPSNSTTEQFQIFVDRDLPTATVLHDPPPFRWTDDGPRTATVTAHDDTSGVANMTLSLPALGGPSLDSFDVACTGAGAQPCPKDPPAHVFTYQTTQLPEGSSQPSLTVADAAGNRSSPPASWMVKLDRTPPTVAYSGSLTQLSGQTLAGGSASLRVDASDVRSGVKSIRILLDGVQHSRLDGVCTDEGCAQGLTLSDSFASQDMSAGQHTVRVETADQVGTPPERHVTVREFTINNVPVDPPVGDRPGSTLGFEHWQTYEDYATGAGSEASVNLTSGNLLWSHKLVDDPGRGLDTVGRLTYNSHEPGLFTGAGLATYNMVGQGFSLGLTGPTRFNQPLEFEGGLFQPAVGSIPGQTIVPPQRVFMTDGDGTRHRFESVGNYQGKNVYRSPTGVFLWFREYEGGANPIVYWAMTAPDGTTYSFDQDGYLTGVADRRFNILLYQYEQVPALEALSTAVRLGRPADRAGAAVTDPEVHQTTGQHRRLDGRA